MEREKVQSYVYQSLILTYIYIRVMDVELDHYTLMRS